MVQPASSRDRTPVIIIGLIVLCAMIFSYLSVVRHYTLNTSAYDLAMYDQAVWNTSQGRWFEINLLEDTMPGLTNKLGDHVEPILLPLALLYRVRSSPDVLLVVQAIALAVLIWPLFHLVRGRTSSTMIAWLSIALYLAHPAMWNALLFDFHPVTLAAAFLVFALWMLIRQRRWLCLVFALLAMACKEQVGLMVVMLGAYAVLFQRAERRLGAILIAIGVAWSVIAIGVINPAFQPIGVSPYLNRYGKLGSTFAEVLLSPFTQPAVVWSIVTNPNRVSYYGDLLLPLGGLPLLGPELILPVLPDVALNTLSAFAPARTLDYHYAVVIAPFLILAVAWGIDRLGRGLSHRIDRRVVVGVVSAFVLVCMAVYHLDRYQTFLPLSSRYASTFALAPRYGAALQIAARIPDDAVVSAQFNLVSHVSQRRRAHIFPRIEDAEYVFLDTQGVFEPFSDRAKYQAAVDALRADPGFETIADQDGFILLHRK